MKTIDEWVNRRATKLLSPIAKFLPGKFYLAGGCFSKIVNDLDLFPVFGTPLVFTEDKHLRQVATTKNATTLKYFDTTIQLCNYAHDNLRSLVDSFDFAHIQIGCLISVELGIVSILDTYASEACRTSRVIGDSWFCGSTYPLSSLVRLAKYHKRGEVSRGGAIEATLSIVAAIAKRGFASYEDFKDQLDAVDLGLLPDELSAVQGEMLVNLFEALKKGTT